MEKYDQDDYPWQKRNSFAKFTVVEPQAHLEVYNGINAYESLEEAPPISIAKVMKTIRKILPADTIIYGDDGSHSFYGAEFSTALHAKIPVIFIVINNGRLDMVDKGMSYNVGTAVGIIYQYPLDISKYGTSMGVLSFRCQTYFEVEETLIKALQIKDQPVVIEIIVGTQEVPPTMDRGLI